MTQMYSSLHTCGPREGQSHPPPPSHTSEINGTLYQTLFQAKVSVFLDNAM